MNKHLRKFASMVALCLSFTMIAPSTQTALAATKTCTDAEQKSGDKVTALEMEIGEKVDLRFEGVSNWKTYTYKWVSSNEKVAEVDSNGLITAKENGTTTIELIVSGGDGTQYTSTGVAVTVGDVKNITIGTATEEQLEYATVEMGKTLSLKANGIPKGYVCTWTSTNEHIAKIDNDGKVTPVTTGLTVIQLKATDTKNGEELEAVPIAVQICESNPTPTPKPTSTSKTKELERSKLLGKPEDCEDLDIIGFSYGRNSVDGIKLCWGGENLSGKRIKYYTITIYFENAVGDPAYDELTHKNYTTIKTVGPVEPNDTILILSLIGYIPTCHKIIIGEITFEYFDGTTDSFWCGDSTTTRNAYLK